MSKRIEADEFTLGEYLNLSRFQFEIPFSQRQYEWTKQEVKRLFNDLINLYFREEDDVHVLNFFTLSRDEKGDVRYIYDGQQRTVTTVMMVGIFVRHMYEKGNKKAASQAFETYIRKDDYLSSADQSDKFKLLFEKDEENEVFYDLLDYESDHNYNRNDYDGTINNLITNYDYLTDLFHQFIEEQNIKAEEIKDIFNKIMDNTELVVLITDTDELAMSMFDTLNTTGKKLENFIVLKNDLVRILSENAVKDTWKAIENNLDGITPNNFINHTASILSGKVTTNNAIDKIYEIYPKNNKVKFSHLPEFLLKASEEYLKIENPSQIDKNNKRLEVKKYQDLSAAIKLFTFKQYKPIILAMLLKGYSLDEINQVLSNFLRLVIGNIYFMGERTNQFETPLSNLGKNIYHNGITTNEIIKQIQKHFPNNKNLKFSIENKEIKGQSDSRKIKYILRETANEVDLDKELVIKSSTKDIHLEHILPKSPSKNSEWKTEFRVEEAREEYTYKIGNLTLLLGNINNSASNKDFSDKKQIYNGSNIPANHDIAKKNNWSKKEIDERSEMMADKITKYLESLTNIK